MHRKATISCARSCNLDEKRKNVHNLHNHWREKIPYLAAGTVFIITSPNVRGWISSFWINLASVWHPFGKEPWTAQLLILWGHRAFVVGFFFSFFTWLSTNMAMSMNMSWSSLMLFSSLMISVCRVSISFMACSVMLSMMIWGVAAEVKRSSDAHVPTHRARTRRSAHPRGEDGRVVALQHALQLFVRCVSASWKHTNVPVTFKCQCRVVEERARLVQWC